MSRPTPPLSERDLRLWRRVARTVRPLRPDEAGSGRNTDAEASGAGPEAGPGPSRSPPLVSAGTRPIVDRPRSSAPADVSTVKRVRRGRVEVEARLDLHGFTQDEAASALWAFLRAQRASGARSVLVITGKGRLGDGVLRARLPDWLADERVRGAVAGFAPAHDRHGGAGAYYVFLKRRPHAPPTQG